MRCETIGQCELWLGDCREVLDRIGPIDAVVTDPPYGQRLNVNINRKGGARDGAVVQRNGKTLKVRPKTHRDVIGDNEDFDPNHLLGLAPNLIIWGAHKFAHRLPPGSWLVWDKVPTGKMRSQGDGEAAWQNIDRPLRIYRLLWDGLCVGKGARHEVTAGQQRLHPTQKPEVLMEWCIAQLPISEGVICDPYMGAGSTGVAAVRAGFRFIGIELDPEYFRIACERVDAAWRQGDLLRHTEPLTVEPFV